MKKKICLAGNGWGAVAAFESLAKVFESIQIASSDNELHSLMRESDVLVSTPESANSDLVICAGYKKIIRKQDLEKKIYINVHYSLLPKYRGLHSVVWAVINGEERIGCSVHLMNEKIDDGPIIVQYETVAHKKTSADIMNECNTWVANNLAKYVVSYINGEVKPVPQERKEATWVPMRDLDDCKIDFTNGYVEVDRLLRALVPPYPQPWFSYRERTFFIVNAIAIKRPYFCTPGRVVNIDSEGVWVKISDGLLLIRELSCEGFRVEFNELRIGARLNQ